MTRRRAGALALTMAALGWAAALLLVVAVMAAWAVVATWNEEARRFSAL